MIRILLICVFVPITCVFSYEISSKPSSYISQNDTASDSEEDEGDDWSGTGEADEDILIEDEDECNDDEGVN